MVLVQSEILFEVKDLSYYALIIGYLISLVVWLFGWWSHRFWAVLLITSAVGIYGLRHADYWALPPLSAAVLFAIGAGVLALSWMRILAFAIGGAVCMALVEVISPSVNSPIMCFISGGVFASILYRLWLMTITSFCSTLVSVYLLLAIIHKLTKANVTDWANKQPVLLNWICLIIAATGVIVQYVIVRRWEKSSGEGGDGEVDTSAGSGKILSWITSPFRRKAA